MYNVFFCLFLTLFNYTNISPHYITFASSKVAKSSQEGLLANTPVKTIDGYKNIQDLNVRDFIIGYDKDIKKFIYHRKKYGSMLKI